MCSIADKPKKKPKHTRLVLPGDKKKPQKQTYRAPDRLGRSLPGQDQPANTAAEQRPNTAPKTEAEGVAEMDLHGVELGFSQPKPKREVPPQAAKERGKTGGMPAQKRAAPRDAQTMELPANAVMMPRKNPRVEAVRRKRRQRRVWALVLVVALVLGLLAYFSGIYLYGVIALQNAYDSLRIRLTPGDGWPAPYSMTGYVTSESMDGGGFASLGDKDMAMFSSSGKELRRTQHGYANPGITAGSTRVCVYNRGGTQYVVEGRGDTLLRRDTEQEILFCEMSPNGTLAVVTSSRYRSSLEVYDPLYGVDPAFSWTMVDEKPVAGAFNSDNRHFVVASLSAKEGALGTTLHFLKTDKAEPLAEVRADDARIVQLQYLSQSRLLAVYDTYTALYSQKGEEVARFDHGGRNLLAADASGGRPVLVFGSAARDGFDVVLLNDRLTPLFEQAATGTGSPRVLGVSDGVYLLCGQVVEAFTLEGAEAGVREYASKPLDLVQAGVPLVLTVARAESLEDMLGGTSGTGASAEGSEVAADGVAGSTAPAASVASSLPAEGEPAEANQPPPEGAAAGGTVQPVNCAAAVKILSTGPRFIDGH